VVIHHADVDVSGWLLRDMPFAWGIGIFQYAAIPIFLLCAGLSMSRIADTRVQLLKTSINYFYIYALWVLISVLLSGYVAKANVSVTSDIGASFWSLCFPHGPLWFPYGLAAMLLCASLTARVDRRVQLLIAIGLGFLPLVIHKELLGRIFYNLIFFYLGLLFRKEIMAALSHRAGVVLAVCLGGYVGLLLLAAELGVAYFPPVYALLGCLAFGALVGFWRAAPLPGAFRVSAMLGRAALPILVMHDFWIHVAERTGQLLGLFMVMPDSVPYWTFPLLIAVFALFMSVLSYEVLSRYRWLFVAPRFLLSPATGVLERFRALWKLMFRRALRNAP